MDDLVSREQVLDVVMRGAQIGITWTVDAIKSLPSAEPKVQCVARIELDVDEVIKRMKKCK